MKKKLKLNEKRAIGEKVNQKICEGWIKFLVPRSHKHTKILEKYDIKHEFRPYIFNLDSLLLLINDSFIEIIKSLLYLQISEMVDSQN